MTKIDVADIGLTQENLSQISKNTYCKKQDVLKVTKELINYITFNYNTKNILINEEDFESNFIDKIAIIYNLNNQDVLSIVAQALPLITNSLKSGFNYENEEEESQDVDVVTNNNIEDDIVGQLSSIIDEFSPIKEIKKETKPAITPGFFTARVSKTKKEKRAQDNLTEVLDVLKQDKADKDVNESSNDDIFDDEIHEINKDSLASTIDSIIQEIKDHKDDEVPVFKVEDVDNEVRKEFVYYNDEQNNGLREVVIEDTTDIEIIDDEDDIFEDDELEDNNVQQEEKKEYDKLDSLDFAETTYEQVETNTERDIFWANSISSILEEDEDDFVDESIDTNEFGIIKSNQFEHNMDAQFVEVPLEVKEPQRLEKIQEIEIPEEVEEEQFIETNNVERVEDTLEDIKVEDINETIEDINVEDINETIEDIDVEAVQEAIEDKKIEEVQEIVEDKQVEEVKKVEQVKKEEEFIDLDSIILPKRKVALKEPAPLEEPDVVIVDEKEEREEQEEVIDVPKRRKKRKKDSLEIVNKNGKQYVVKQINVIETPQNAYYRVFSFREFIKTRKHKFTRALLLAIYSLLFMLVIVGLISSIVVAVFVLFIY